tara:strand:- start:76 stop:744 length:669 start_codon:yes stop_codon:yes gene_type:complete
MSYIIITKKIWDKSNFKNLSKKIKVFQKIEKYKINKINPKIIFFIHWSKLIPKNIYENYTCIQFHLADLPKGRGGSPIQNQILINIKKTQISAFRVEKELDSGPICAKQNFFLNGNLESILKKMEIKSINIVKKLIKKKKIIFKKQIGKPTFFKRRKPEESEINISKIKTINKMYDFLRMLDAPDYPSAFIKLKEFKITFNDIKKKHNIIKAKVKIIKNEKR